MSKMSGKKGFILGILFTLFMVFVVLPTTAIVGVLTYETFKTQPSGNDRLMNNMNSRPKRLPPGDVS